MACRRAPTSSEPVARQRDLDDVVVGVVMVDQEEEPLGPPSRAGRPRRPGAARSPGSARAPDSSAIRSSRSCIASASRAAERYQARAAACHAATRHRGASVEVAVRRRRARPPHRSGAGARSNRCAVTPAPVAPQCRAQGGRRGRAAAGGTPRSTARAGPARARGSRRADLVSLVDGAGEVADGDGAPLSGGVDDSSGPEVASRSTAAAPGRADTESGRTPGGRSRSSSRAARAAGTTP